MAVLSHASLEATVHYVAGAQAQGTSVPCESAKVAMASPSNGVVSFDAFTRDSGLQALCEYMALPFAPGNSESHS